MASSSPPWRIAHEPHIISCDHCHEDLAVGFAEPCESVVICMTCVHNTSEFVKSGGQKP